MTVTARHNKAAAGPPTFSDATKLSLDAQLSLAVQVLGTTYYHSSRRDYLERWHKVLMFLVIGVGTAAMGSTLGGWWFGRFLYAVPVLAGMLIVVFDLPGRARRHELLLQRYSDLLTDVEHGPSSSQSVKRWRRRFFEISSGEPPIMNALVATSYNSACQTITLTGAQLKVPWHHRMMKNFFRFDGSVYETMYDPAQKPEAIIGAVLETLSDTEPETAEPGKSG